jgi:hypothetical protein
VLETEAAHLLRRRPDEHDASGLAFVRKRCVLAEESVARMYGLRTRLASCRNDSILLEITFRGWRRSNAHSLVGHCDVHGVTIGVGVNSDGANAQASQGAQNSAGNRAAIGDQHLLEHENAFDPTALKPACQMPGRPGVVMKLAGRPASDGSAAALHQSHTSTSTGVGL